MSHFNEIFLHVPGTGRAALGAKSTMQADVLVLHHDPSSLQIVGDIEILGMVLRWRTQPRPQFIFFPIRGEGDAIHRADIDAGIAFDAELAAEHRLHVAIQAAICFAQCEIEVVTEFDLRADVLQRHLLVAQRYAVAVIGRDFVMIGPFMNTQFLTLDLHVRQRTFLDVLAGQQTVDRECCIVAMCHC